MAPPITLAGAAVMERLPGLFDKRFVVGALLPATLFSGASLLAAQHWGLISLGELWRAAETDDQVLAALVVVAGIFLLAVLSIEATTFIVRRLEGYGPWPGRRRARRRQVRRFHELRERIRDACPEDASGSEGEPASLDCRRLKALRATFFPPHEEEILPTVFGNVVRAFESYSVVVYGFESTRGWTRLLAVLPEEYRAVIDDARAQVDLRARLWAFSAILAVEPVVFTLLGGWRWAVLWLPIAALATAVLMAWCARQAAVRWGETVKGAFDVYLPELRRRLGLGEPRSRDEERLLWRQFSEAFLLHDPDYLPRLVIGPLPSPPPGPDPGRKEEPEDSRRGLRPV